MTKFIRKDGSSVIVNSFMQGPELSDGYCWSDESALGSAERIWLEVVKPYETDLTIAKNNETLLYVVCYSLVIGRHTGCQTNRGRK